MYGVDAPHNNDLVLTFNINTFDIKRVLIDLRSSSDIMYHNLYKKLKVPASQVRSANMSIFNFSGKAVWPIAIAEVLDSVAPLRRPWSSLL